MDLVVDETYYGRGINVVKEESRLSYPNNEHYEEDNHKENPDPFLFTDTKVMRGYGKALVVCVGSNTLLAKMRKPNDMVIQEQ